MHIHSALFAADAVFALTHTHHGSRGRMKETNMLKIPMEWMRPLTEYTHQKIKLDSL